MTDADRLPTRDECIDRFADAIVDIWYALSPETQAELLAQAKAATEAENDNR